MQGNFQIDLITLQDFIESNDKLHVTIRREEMEDYINKNEVAEYLDRSEELGAKNAYMNRAKLIKCIIACRLNLYSIQCQELQIQKKKLNTLKENKKKKPPKDTLSIQESLCKEVEAKMMQNFLHIVRLRLMYNKFIEA